MPSEQKQKLELDPKTIMAMTDAALSFLENAIPKIQDLFKSGAIDSATQQGVYDRAQKLAEAKWAFTRPS